MELEQLIELIGAVSESKLTDFQYEESGVKIRLKKETEKVRVQTGGADSASAAAANAAAFGTLQAAAEGVQTTAVSGNLQTVPGAFGTVQAASSAAGTVQAAAGAFPTVQSAEAAVVVQAAGTAVPSDAKIVKSPLVGVFYAAPAEDAKPYVSVGDTVKKGQILACVEAMKLMNEIESDYDGVVAEILVENGQGVGYGEPLFVIR